jgi:hypothetical protein
MSGKLGAYGTLHDRQILCIYVQAMQFTLEIYILLYTIDGDTLAQNSKNIIFKGA